MISRLTASAALFAVLATAGIAFTAEAQQRPVAKAAASQPTAAVTLPTVQVTGKRDPAR